ncbi:MULTISPECIES: site-2 protease family protein [Streptomyces]|uniref:site-2 protease family protein n=1 Tax=Streptomyces TaxID=1883 RepID=UPI003136A971
MNATLRLGRIAGVRVGVHWSTLFIVLLVVPTLALGRFPQAYPGEPAWAYWGLGLVAALVFIVSLLAHDMAHAVVARRSGVAVDGVTLWMFGGGARLRGEARDPCTELRIAGVGPLTSLVAAVFFTGTAAWMAVLSAPGLAVECVGWLAAMNFVLAVFNALPAAPLDGGRVLRAYLWHRGGDPVRAARGAAMAGRYLGWFMLLTGFASVLLSGVLVGLWAALVGWFLIAAGTAEGRVAQLQEALHGVTVRQVMTRSPVTVAPSETVAGFLGALPFRRHAHVVVPVVACDGDVVGLVSVRRINRVPMERRPKATIGDFMRPVTEVVTAAPDDSVADLVPRLEGKAKHLALVLEGGRLVGVVAQADIKWMVSRLTTDAQLRS